MAFNGIEDIFLTYALEQLEPQLETLGLYDSSTQGRLNLGGDIRFKRVPNGKLTAGKTVNGHFVVFSKVVPVSYKNFRPEYQGMCLSDKVNYFIQIEDKEEFFTR